MNLLLFVIGIWLGYIFSSITNKPKYIYGFDCTDQKQRPLRLNRKSKAVEFIILAKNKNGDPSWHSMDSSHNYKFTAYTESGDY